MTGWTQGIDGLNAVERVAANVSPYGKGTNRKVSRAVEREESRWSARQRQRAVELRQRKIARRRRKRSR